MTHELDQIIYYLNQDFHNHLGSFSGTILKETSPAIILIEDHVQRHLVHALYQYPEFVAEIEETIFRCLIDVRGKQESEDPTEIFIAKAQLYSPYHYLVTFL
jgi:hypothetical protein